MSYFDSHTHLNLPEFNEDLKEVIERAKKEDVSLVNVGTDFETSKLAVDLAEENENMFATVGLHPNYESKEFNEEEFKKIAEYKKVVAIGECGLDYYRLKPNDKEVIEEQRKLFIKQVNLAKETSLPLMIHCRPSKDKKSESGYSQDAYEDVISIIEPEINNIKGGIIHFFVGNKKMANNFIDLGFYFTFGGVVTFTRVYDDVIKSIPLDKILLETDAPYVSPEPHRGKRNEPVFIKEVYKKIGEIKNVSLDELKKVILENNKRIFNIDNEKI